MSEDFQLLDVKKVAKPWGHELIWAHTERYVGKILHVKRGESLSRQYHVVKDETLYLLSGLVRIGLQSEDREGSIELNPGEAFHVYPGLIHHIAGVEDSDILEVSTPELTDVVRLDDRYGRQGTNAP